MILWGTQRMLTKDHPRDFSRHRPISISIGAPITVTQDDDAGEATANLRSTMAKMLDETIQAYPEQPAGAWWLPAAYGGSAPTPEEAERLDREELARRAAKRQEPRHQ
jgi:hypothetical protein